MTKKFPVTAGMACVLIAILSISPPVAARGEHEADVARWVRELGDPDPLVREKAAESLGSVRPVADGTVRVLAGALADADPFVAGAAAASLAAFGRRSAAALAAALRAERAETRLSAAIALARLGPAAEEAVPGLIEAAKDQDPNVRWCVVVALGNAGKRAKVALPVLLEALEDGDADVRWGASRAIAKIDPETARGPFDWRPAAARIESLLPGLMKEFHVPGVSVALVSKEGVVWSHGAGVLRSDRPEPVTRETLFEACSMSKPVFAYLAMKLVEEGRLGLDVPLSRYFEDPALLGQPGAELITARMVLSHATGLPNWRKGGEERGGPLPVWFRPGSRFGYSGEGMFYLQRVIEGITGDPLDVLARKMMFGPLGLEHAGYAWTSALDLALASGHKESGDFLQKTRYVHANAGYSLYISAEDYARFLVEMMKADRSAPCSVSRASVEEMLRPQTGLGEREPIERPGRAKGFAVYWGLGWSLNETASGWIAHHSGANSSGFRCFSQFHPDKGTGLVIMTNGLGGGDLWTRIVKEIGDY
jgi:CubicO group peptidase (beta-lactamase class C family)